LTGITCFDTAFNDQFPPGAAAYAAYVGGGVGNQPNYAYIVSAFPGAEHLSIALFAADDAQVLDVENFAASPADIPGWHARQVARGIQRPVIYASAFTMEDQVLPVVNALPRGRASTRLWTAHYGIGEHICGPASCAALSIEADGTQWTSSAMGRILDQSLLAADFFGVSPVPVIPVWQESMLQALPIVRQGSTGGIVRTIQGLCVARGQAVTVDGSFGPKTAGAVVALQKAARVADDGAVGEQTWPILMGIA
jgi:hypothetical protein